MKEAKPQNEILFYISKIKVLDRQRCQFIDAGAPKDILRSNRMALDSARRLLLMALLDEASN